MATHEFTCTNCGFRSSGWETKKDMLARKAQHDAEHETKVAMPEVADFMAGNKEVQKVKKGGKS